MKKMASKAKVTSEIKRFSVTFQVRGSVLDDDTVIGEKALEAYFEMMFASPKAPLEIFDVEAKEIKN